MFLSLPRTSCRVLPVCWARSISQFRIPLTDCIPPPDVRTVVHPQKCGTRDRGLVLGVYRNDAVPGEPAILTASAQKYDRSVGGKLWELLKLSPIPRLGECRVFFDVDPHFGYVAVAGLGSECLKYNTLELMDESREAIRVAAGVGARELLKLNPTHISLEAFGNAEAAAEGGGLAVWRFTEYRRPSFPADKTPTLDLYDDCDHHGWKLGAMKAESQNLARYLTELPPNVLNPTKFAKLIIDLLCELDINVEVRTKGWAAAHQMGGFVAVGESSVQPPLYVEISYYGANECTQPIVLIGKGVTFDSGSLDLKSCEDLRYMRGDMAGAAAVVATVRAASLLKLPVNIRGILPLCELMPSGKSPKYGDVVCSGGRTVHIRLPSREGRLLIADSLVYARNYWPRMILDIGTMSKELISSLDGAACGVYSNDECLFEQLQRAGGYTGDRVWRMPLWRFYEDRVEDSVADVANTGVNLVGDSPNCAAFLRKFVCDSKWAHLDTYNVTYTKGRDFPYLKRGMTGRPTRTLIELIHIMLAHEHL